MMRVGKWVLGIAALALLFGSVADAQIQANTLCVQAGGAYYVNGPFYGYPNHGGSKYFPSYAHIPAAPVSATNLVYPWKIAGWAWTGMQANQFGVTWYWETCLQSSMDNPMSSAMSFDYPVLFCTGAVAHSGSPAPTYGGNVPSSVPIVGGHAWLFPSSMGGWDAYLNIFAVGGASWTIPSTSPFYGWTFGFASPCASAITVPSGNSILQYTWSMYGPFGEYLILDGDDVDCLGGGANKGRNYSLISDVDNGYLWYWSNGCTGIQQEWAMCLWVCDTVSVPVNIPGSAAAANPFINLGFSVGAGTLTPYLSSNCVQLGFMSQDYTGLEGPRIALGAFSFSPGKATYGQKKYRLPHGWDVLTNFFVNISPLFLHIPAPGYPAAMFGTTIGMQSPFIPFPADPALLCAELTYSTWAFNNNVGSAGYTVTLF
jgi:hypothetical protein